MQFDGVDDCAIFPYADELLLDSGLTIAAWMQRSGPGDSFMGAITKPVGDLPYNSWRLAAASNNSIGTVAHFHVGIVDDSGGTLQTPITDQQWSHIVGTWDGATMRLWQDGVLIDTVDNDLYEVDDQPVFIGCDDEHGDEGIARFLYGALDDVRVYGRVLTPDEIAALADGGG